MSENYVNPAADGGWVAPHGDRPSPKSPGGAKSGNYDNAAPSTSSPQATKSVKPAEHVAATGGRDDVGINGDYGFSGNPKKRSPKI
jgi:hypothetical protein